MTMDQTVLAANPENKHSLYAPFANLCLCCVVIVVKKNYRNIVCKCTNRLLTWRSERFSHGLMVFYRLLTVGLTTNPVSCLPFYQPYSHFNARVTT